MPHPYPETTDQLKHPSVFRRLMSLVYDALILVALWMLIAALMLLINRGEEPAPATVQATLFTCTYLFLAFFWTRNGQTLGMQAWRLRVQTTQGERLTLMQSLKRYCVGVLSFLCFGLGFFWFIFSSSRQTWYDMAADTWVAELPPR